MVALDVMMDIIWWMRENDNEEMLDEIGVDKVREVVGEGKRVSMEIIYDEG